MAEHQITLGDDKVYIQKGTKLGNGGMVNGVRGIQISGQAPVVSPGRSGDQYLNYQLSQIKEMYEAVNLSELFTEKQQSGDAYQMLYRSMKEKKTFSMYATKYERFEINIFEKVLEMASNYIEPEELLSIIGKKEQINIEEFYDMTDRGFQLKLVPQSGDVESKFGKILSITQTLQYAGKQLSPDQIGTMIKQLPFGNEKQMFSTLTSDSDNATNDILALDRGRYVPANAEDSHEFMISALTHRMKQPDFKFLSVEIQQLYAKKRQEHSTFMAQQNDALERAKLGQIPTGGFLVTVNASWFNPAANRVERIKVPYAALQHLVSKLEQQGLYAQQLSGLPVTGQLEVSAMEQQLTEAPMIPGLSGTQATPIIEPQAQGV